MQRFSDLVEVGLAAHALAVAIVNLTPTPKDDEALDNFSRTVVKVYRAIEILAGVITPHVKR